jgi:undecaprenyl pyrophosphate synthase
MENISIEKLIEENKLLKEKINELTEHLKKYTAPKRNKKFYENHKEEIIKKVMEYKEKNKDKKLDPEKIKEYNRRAYLKRKEKNTENS